MRTKSNLAIPLAILLIVLTATAAWAQPPPLPSSFYGAVQATRDDLSTGATVSAAVGGEAYAQTNLIYEDDEWFFALDVPADDPTTEAIEGGRPGDTVTFLVNDQPVATAEWQSGANMRVDLVVPELAPAQARGPEWVSVSLSVGLLVGLLMSVWRWRRRMVLSRPVT